MAKWSGKVGYETTFETEPGIWKEQIIERSYYGDIIQNSRRLESGDAINSSINISNRISFVADPYARENFHAIRYAEFMGAKWRVTDIEVQYPRLVLNIGGVYNGK